MRKTWNPLAQLCLLGSLLVFPALLGCASGAVVTADPVDLEETEDEDDEGDDSGASR